MKTKKIVRFLQPRELPSVIWDAENNCPLVEFFNWTYSTSNIKIIKKLKEMGYHVEGVDQIPAHLHQEGAPPIEPVTVPDKKHVPPRPQNIPRSEAEDMARSPKASHKVKPVRKLKKRKSNLDR